MRIGRAAVADDFGVDRGAARRGRGEILNDEGARTFTQDEAGAIHVVRSAGRRWPFAVARTGEAAHVHEADVCHFKEWVLGGAGNDRSHVAALDRLGRLAQGVRAGGAGGDDRKVVPHGARLDGDHARGAVDETVGDEGRRNGARPLLLPGHLVLDEEPLSASARAEDHTDLLAVRVGDLES